MLRCRFLSCLALLCISTLVSAQTTSSPGFLEQAQSSVLGGKSIHSITFNANAEWFAGSTHETGSGSFQANSNGSSKLQLDLGKASREESQTKLDPSRICEWTDASGASHEIVGVNCMASMIWFAPTLNLQPLSQLPSMLTTSDGGEVVRKQATFHQITYGLNIEGITPADTIWRQQASVITILFDPQTSLPSSLEYSIRADNNELQSIPIRVQFSNYQPVSGVMLPFHIERYVQNSLQLKLDVSNATIE
jgi:hypothetical protein